MIKGPGTPWEAGIGDAYYGIEPIPNYWTIQYNKGHRVFDLTEQQIEEYIVAYRYHCEGGIYYSEME